MEELWEVFDHNDGSNIELVKLGPEEYKISVTTSWGCESTKKLDRKHLKDLFLALRNELEG